MLKSADRIVTAITAIILAFVFDGFRLNTLDTGRYNGVIVSNTANCEYPIGYLKLAPCKRSYLTKQLIWVPGKS